jgi:hypothetical protein
VQSPSVSPRGDRVAFYESQEGRGTGTVMVVDREGKRAILGSGSAACAAAYTSVKMQGLRFAPSGEGGLAHGPGGRGRDGPLRLVPGRWPPRGGAHPGAALLRDIAGDGRVLLSRDLVRAEIRGRGPATARSAT